MALSIVGDFSRWCRRALVGIAHHGKKRAIAFVRRRMKSRPALPRRGQVLRQFCLIRTLRSINPLLASDDNNRTCSMRILSRPEIQSALSHANIATALRNAYVSMSRGEAQLPPVGSLAFPADNGDCHIKFGH